MSANILDFHHQENFDRTVFVVEDGQVREEVLRDLCTRYAEKIDGKPIFYVSGRRLLCRKDPGFLMTFDSDNDAINALLNSHKNDLENGWFAPNFFTTRKEAEDQKAY